MGITYRQIDELPGKTSFTKNDMFLVATPNSTELGYVTYKTTFQALSSNLVKDSQQQAFEYQLITNVNELDSDASDKAVAGNVGYIINNGLNTVKNNYLNKNASTTSQTISGPITFSQSPIVPYVATTSISNNAIAVNARMVEEYVSRVRNLYPVFTTLFCNQDLDNTPMNLVDVLPKVDSTKYTIFVKFKSTDKSSSERKVSFVVHNGDATTAITVISGWQALKFTAATKKAEAVNHTWWYAKAQVGIPSTDNASDVWWTIDNVHKQVNVSLAIYDRFI